MKCANCGGTIPDRSVYCAYCGTQIPTNPVAASSARRLVGVIAAVGVLMVSGIALVLALVLQRPTPFAPPDTPAESGLTSESTFTGEAVPTVRLISTVIPTSRPGATRVPTRPTSLPTHIQPPRISPTPSLTAEIDAALREYARVRKEAEETLNPELLQQVCVDPYLSWKTARIQENLRDGTHWETQSASFTIISLSTLGADRVDVHVRKTETKLFFPRGSAVPDDEICKGSIYSYRNCTYEAEYTMVRRSGRWYVSDAKSVTDCQPRCQH
jgi:hypothetical protein